MTAYQTLFSLLPILLINLCVCILTVKYFIGKNSQHGEACSITAHTGAGQKLRAESLLTNDDRVVIGNQQLAVDIDELSDQFSFQLCIRSEPTEGNVIDPLISN